MIIRFGFTRPSERRRSTESSCSLKFAFAFSFDAGDFVLFEQECLLHGRSSAVAHSRVWTRDGRLLASYAHEAQLELIAPLPPRRSERKTKL